MRLLRPTFSQILFVLIAGAVLGALTFFIASTLLKPQLEGREIRARAVELAKMQNAELERIILAEEAKLTSFASAEALRPVATENCSRYFGALSQQHPHLGLGGIITSAGTIRCGPSDDTVADAAKLALTGDAAIREGRFKLGGFARSKAKEPTGVLQMAAPITRHDGPSSEAIVAEMRLDWLAERIDEKSLGDEATLTIADRDAIALVGDKLFFKVVGSAVSPLQQSLLKRSEPGVAEAEDQFGRRYYIAYFPPQRNGIDLYLSVDLYRDELFSGLDGIFDKLYLAVVGSALAVSALMTWLIGRRIFRSRER